MTKVRTAVAGLAVLAMVIALAPTGVTDEHDGADAFLWSQGGENSSWDFDGSAYATNHDGDYNGSECAFIESPSLPLAVSTELTIEHSFNYEQAFSGRAWDGGAVLVSTDLGSTWQYLAADGYTSSSSYSGVYGCINDLTGESEFGYDVFTGAHSGVTTTVDLADHGLALGDTVQVRLVSASDSIIQYPGWTVDDVVIGGIPTFLA